jgi:hypothetical protein
MKFRFGIIWTFIAIGFLNLSTPVNAGNDNGTWSRSYQSYRNHFKSLSPSEVTYCEKLLKEIVNDLDTKNQCSVDDDCVLIDQDPFGATVPFPGRLSEAMKSKMKEYSERCDDGFSHSFRNKDVVDAPVCWKGKCMVKTGFRQKGSR